jgi:hypothetical protein
MVTDEAQLLQEALAALQPLPQLRFLQQPTPLQPHHQLLTLRIVFLRLQLFLFRRQLLIGLAAFVGDSLFWMELRITF